MSPRTILLSAYTPTPTRVPLEFRILKPGVNKTRNGDVVFDNESARLVIEEFKTGGVDLPIDLNHAMADPFAAPETHAALGWFVPEVRDGVLWASQVTWTEDGQEEVESRAWRYTSLWGDIAPVDPAATDSPMRLVRLRTVSVVNRPALLQSVPLVASEATTNPTEVIMSLSPVAILLSAQDEPAAVQAVRTMQAQLGDVVSSLKVSSTAEIPGALQALQLKAASAEALQAKLDEEVAAKAKAEKAALIAKLGDEKKLPPSLIEWANAQSIESLRACGDGAPVLASEQRIPDAKADKAGASVSLSDEEKQIAKLMGQDPAKVAAHKSRFGA